MKNLLARFLCAKNSWGVVWLFTSGRFRGPWLGKSVCNDRGRQDDNDVDPLYVSISRNLWAIFNCGLSRLVKQSLTPRHGLYFFNSSIYHNLLPVKRLRRHYIILRFDADATTGLPTSPLTMECVRQAETVFATPMRTLSRP